MVPRAHAAGLHRATVVMLVAAIAVIILDSSLGVFSPASGGAKGAAVAAVIVVNLAAAAVAFWGAMAWQAARAGPAGVPASGIGRYGVPALNATGAFLAPWLLFPVEAVAGWRQINKARNDLVPDKSDHSRAELEYQEQYRQWQQRIAQFNAAEQRRCASADLWYPAEVSPESRMVCAFGGSHISWAAALTVVAATAIGSGARVFVADLSRRRTTDPLIDLCRQVGVPVTRASLPGGNSAALFAGLGWRDLTTTLAEVFHSRHDDDDTSRRERQEDRGVMLDVAACLDPDAPVSIGRLRRAMLVIEGADPGPGAVMTDSEVDRLSFLYNEVQRQHGGVMERVTRIERALRDFEILEDGDDRARGEAGGIEGRPRVGGGRAALDVVEVSKTTADLDNERLVDLLFQLLMLRVRTGQSGANLLVLLGADRIRRGMLESLVTHAQQDQLPVLLFFEHLRDDAVDVVGGGGAAACFFALGNHREAQEAAQFIGTDFKWVESQHTRSSGESLTRTWGQEQSESESRSRGFPGGSSSGVTISQGRSYSESFGQTTEYSVGDQRVEEHLVRAEELMGLPATGMICVEVKPGGRRLMLQVDCHPQVRFAPRVSSRPFAR